MSKNNVFKLSGNMALGQNINVNSQGKSINNMGSYSNIGGYSQSTQQNSYNNQINYSNNNTNTNNTSKGIQKNDYTRDQYQNQYQPSYSNSNIKSSYNQNSRDIMSKYDYGNNNNYGNSNYNQNQKKQYGQYSSKSHQRGSNNKNNYNNNNINVQMDYNNYQYTNSNNKPPIKNIKSSNLNSNGNINTDSYSNNYYNNDYKNTYDYSHEKTKSRIPPKSEKKIDSNTYDDQQYSNLNVNKRSNISKSNNQPSNSKSKYTAQSYSNKNYNYPSQNQHEDRPIKEVNKENRIDIQQYDPSQFVQCRQGCGRKFNPQSLTKHQNICKKVFQKKRKQFDAQAHRVVQKQQVKLMKKGQIVQKKLQNAKKKSGTQKMAKWKAQSLAFRAVLKQNQKGDLSQADKKLIQQVKQVQDQSMIQCPHCGRKFNQKAGPRHITFCENQQKKMGNKKKK